MMLPGLTVRNRYGSADLVPFLRRAAGQKAALLDWEKPAGVIALDALGWDTYRISRAVGMNRDRVEEILSGGHQPKLEVRDSQRQAPEADLDDEEQRRLLLKRQQVQRNRSARLAERVMRDGRWFHPRAPHGDPHTYNNWGCHCTPCAEAYSTNRSRRRRKGQA